MRPIAALLFVLIFVLSPSRVQAQASEVIWLTVDATSLKTGETVRVWVNAVSVTPIQGFTFQIRYDPNCLKPLNAASPIAGMNGLGLPQTDGLVDASFASTVPQIVNGVLAEVRFETRGGCQTTLNLESAALAVRNASGFAAPLPGVKLGESKIALSIDSAPGIPASQALAGTPLPLDPSPASAPASSLQIGWIAVFTILLIGLLGFGINRALQKTVQ